MPRTSGGFSLEAAQKFGQIAADCVAPLRKNRPDMLHVASALRALKAPADAGRPGVPVAAHARVHQGLAHALARTSWDPPRSCWAACFLPC